MFPRDSAAADGARRGAAAPRVREIVGLVLCGGSLLLLSSNGQAWGGGGKAAPAGAAVSVTVPSSQTKATVLTASK